MVDAADKMESNSADRPAIHFKPIGEGPLKLFCELCAKALHSPTQSPLWIRTWAGTVNSDIIVGWIEQRGKPVFAIALEVADFKGCRIARYPGGSHANGNFPPATARIRSSADRNPLTEFMRRLSEFRPDIDLVFLERQEAVREGYANPLATFDNFESPNIALAADLTGGFDELLSTVNGKRKRKKHRSHSRKFEEDGGFRCIRSDSRQTSDRMLDFFFGAKAERFTKAGIANVFGEPDVQLFFRKLFARSAEMEQPPFVLNGLEVAGQLRAVTGTSVSGKRITSEFGAVDDDDASRTSPGEFLYFENIAAACKEGYKLYDFSVGDEPYKRQWCQLETCQFDTLYPLNWKGRFYAAAIRASSAGKRWVKRNSGLWTAARMLRAALPR